MRKIRNCASAKLNTGVSKCQIDFGKIKGAIIVESGVKLPAELTGEDFEKLCHANRPDRALPVLLFVEYAKNGGEPQVSAVGYGGNQVSSVNARTDTFTLDKFYESLNASMLKTMNVPFDVYYFDDKNMLYGYNDGSDVLAGVPMSTIYPIVTPHPTSSAKSTMTVNFCLEDAQDAMENFDYVQLDFDLKRFAIGLVGVQIVQVEGSKYKIVEAIGGYDRTAEFGTLIADNAASTLTGVSSAQYDEETETLTLTVDGNATPKLKKPAELYKAGVKGIEQV